MSSNHLPLYALFSAITLYGLYRVLRMGHRPKSYPPGPPTLPIVGNLHQMPSRDAHKQFQKWAREYGPIFSLILGTKTMIVLSSDVAVKELLDKRSAIYSDRPDAYVGMNLCSGNLRMLMMKYGPTWRMIRKLCHHLLNINHARAYVPYQVLENKQLLYALLEQPENFVQHVRRYSTSLTTSMTFGWRTPTSDDPSLKELFENFEEFTVLNQAGTAALIDYFPILQWLPGFIFPTQRQARQLFKRTRALHRKHWLATKSTIEASKAPPCLCVSLAKEQVEGGFNDDLAAFISGTMHEAGSDTTANTLLGFLLGMIAFPDVQAKAHAVLDSVIGPNRLPTMEDEHDLQYIRACVKESLRWFPVAVFGAAPHATTCDDSYLGYQIPRGAAVVNNIYGIHNDPARYPRPREFNPDRFIDDTRSSHEATMGDVSQRDHFGFGAGRRVCQGMHIADRSLFLGISRILWAFDILPAKDAKGMDVMPDTENITQGFICAPLPFQARVVARSEERAEIVRKEWREAETLLDPVSKQWKKIPEGMTV